MKHTRIITLLGAAALLAGCNSGETTTTKRVIEQAATVFEYTPAPGQFINEPLSGYTDVTTPEKACAYAMQRFASRLYVSLGGWGGYLVVGFAEPVPQNGGGELLVRGNSFVNSSEPGVVYVMRDENGNGLPDDTWYELRGSEYDRSTHDYSITYTRPAGANQPVAWRDNKGGKGEIARIGEHTQESYYPAWIETDELSFTGVRLPDNIVRKEVEGTESWTTAPFAWGYADNYSSQDLIGGYNTLNISDAVTADGAPANLPQIDFVKVQSGINASAPLIGEVSTEVCGVACYREVTE